MKAIPADAALVEAHRQREHLGDFRPTPVERGVEAHELWYVGPALGHRPDRRQFLRLMERRQGDQGVQHGQDGVVHAQRAVVLPAAVDDAMADGNRPGIVEVTLEPCGDRIERPAMIDGGDRLRSATAHREPRMDADAVDEAVYAGTQRFIGGEHRKLEAG